MKPWKPIRRRTAFWFVFVCMAVFSGSQVLAADSSVSSGQIPDPRSVSSLRHLLSFESVIDTYDPYDTYTISSVETSVLQSAPSYSRRRRIVFSTPVDSDDGAPAGMDRPRNPPQHQQPQKPQPRLPTRHDLR